jgi:hypothetical protein
MDSLTPTTSAILIKFVRGHHQRAIKLANFFLRFVLALEAAGNVRRVCRAAKCNGKRNPRSSPTLTTIQNSFNHRDASRATQRPQPAKTELEEK